MPRTYKRSSARQSWSEEALVNALEAIKNGSKIRQAGLEYGIPESTLRDKIKLKEGKLLPSLGRKPTFSLEMERKIANHAFKLADMFYGLTPTELRKVAYEFAEKNHLNHNFNKDEKIAGKDWLYSFIKRNPDVRLREPEKTSINRIASFNEEEVQLFYKNLETVMSKFSFPPNRTFNVDETGVSNVLDKPVKVYAKKGQRRVGTATSAEKGKTITVVCCFNAAGGYVPPMIIYPRKRMAAHLQRDGPVGTSYQVSNNGWINEQLWLNWLRHFYDNVKPSEMDPVLLICDNHGSHVSLEAYDFCKQNNITVVTIPPHTSHRLQPLDVCFYGPLKKALAKEYHLHMVQNAHKAITTADVPRLLNTAYLKAATMDKAISGFRSTGIVPFNPDKFTQDDFAPAEEFRQLMVYSDPSLVTESPSTTQQDQVPSTSTGITDQSIPELISSTQTNSEKVSISDVAPIPKFCAKNIARKSDRKQHSQVFTSTPVKVLLENKKKTKEEKERLKEERKKTRELKRKLKFDSAKKNTREAKPKKMKKKKTEESEESEVSEKDVVDDNEFDDIETSLTDKNNEKCIYCEDFGRDNENWFRCVKCGFWAHEACSGWDSPEDYLCDFCMRKERKMKAMPKKNP